MELISLPDIVKLVASADVKRQNNKENLVVNAINVQNDQYQARRQNQAQAYYPPAQNYGRNNFRRGNNRQGGNRYQRAPYQRMQQQGNGRNVQPVVDGPTCPKCNFRVHVQGEVCPAIGARCRHCKIIGHYQRCCPRLNQVGAVQENDWQEMLG